MATYYKVVLILLVIALLTFLAINYYANSYREVRIYRDYDSSRDDDRPRDEEETVDPYLPPQNPVMIPSQKTCYVGGCSGQICSDTPDVVSTCEYREEYACYKSARCELQPSGTCGWSETSDFLQCLANAR